MFGFGLSNKHIHLHVLAFKTSIYMLVLLGYW